MRRIRRLAILVAAAASVSGLWTGNCLAGPPLRLSLENCEGFEPDEVERILLLELGAKPAEADSVLVTDVTIHCGTQRNIITVRDPITRKVLRRSIRFESAEDEGQARLLALAASELLLASWAELESNSQPLVEPEGPAPSLEAILDARDALHSHQQKRQRGVFAPADLALANAAEPKLPAQLSARERKEQERARSNLRIVAMATGRGIVGIPGMLYGGGIRAGQDRLGIVSWTVDTLLEGGSVHRNAGTLSLTAVTVGGTVGLSYQLGNLSFRAGGGLRWGLTSVRADNEPDKPSLVTLGPWGWPMGNTSLTIHTGGGMLAELGAEAGYAVLPVGGNDSGIAAPALRGAWVGGMFGLGFGP